MPSKPIRATAIAALAAALLAGAFDFPRALEPSRSDRDGFVLRATLGTGDWVRGSPMARMRAAKGGGLDLRATPGGSLLLVTRSLPVDPDACYVALVRARTLRGRVTIAVYDESIRRLLAEEFVPRTVRPTLHALRFEPAGRARVTFAVVNIGTQGRLFIDWLRVARRPC